MEFPSEIPERLRGGAQPLPHENGWVWNRNDVLDVIEALEDSWVVIHAGDIYHHTPWGWIATGEGWVCEPVHGELSSEYAGRSHALARDFLEERPAREEWVLLVLSWQDEAA